MILFLFACSGSTASPPVASNEKAPVPVEAPAPSEQAALSLRIPSEKLVADKPFGVVLSFSNPSAKAHELAVSAETVTLTAKGPEEKTLAVQWSTSSVKLEPGNLAAVFGQVSLPAGHWTLTVSHPDVAQPEAVEIDVAGA